MDKPAVERLLEGARKMGVEVPSEKARALIEFAELLLKWNAKLNLSALRTLDAVVENHLLDSLALQGVLSGKERILDVGSGPGVPGLVLKLAGHFGAVTSVEAVAKKIAFQKQAIAALRIRDVTALQKTLTPNDAGALQAFDVAVSRAFTDPERWLEFGRAFVRPGGQVVGMVSEAQLAHWSPPDVGNHAYMLPFSKARRFLWIYTIPSDVPRGT